MINTPKEKTVQLLPLQIQNPPKANPYKTLINMIAIILAAGYATRLYPITKNFPKPLLKIGNNSILDYLIHDLENINNVERYIIVTNHKFIIFFNKWKEQCNYKKRITIIDDGSISNESRLGAVKDLLLAIETENIKDSNLLVLAADNLLNFSLKGFVDYFYVKNTSLIMSHYEPSFDKLQKTGVITIDENRKVIEMQEKPDQPKSNWAVPPFYIFAKNDVQFIFECINNGCPTDAPGSLAIAMLEKTTLHAWEMKGSRKDIGTLDTYYQTCKKYI